MVVAAHPRQAGVTLIELITAIALSTVVVLLALALFRDVGFAARITGGKRDAAFQAQAAFVSLSENLMTGGGILRLAQGRAELLNRRNRRVTYAWSDSALTVNGVAWKFRLASLDIRPMGPVRPDWKPFAGGMPWELDSLDGNHDGAIDFEELDQDGDGALEPDECRFIAGIRITLVAIVHGAPLSYTCLVHPRNRVPAAIGADAEDVMGSGGIPDP